MFYFVLAIALLNIGLGYAVGVYWRNMPPSPATAFEPVVPNVESPVVASAPAAPKGPDEPEVPDEPESIVVAPQKESGEIPRQWLEMLEDVGESASFVEAAVHVFELELGKYRDELIDIDVRVRTCVESSDESLLRTCLEDLKTANESYLERQDSARSHLTEEQDNLGALTDIGLKLEDVMLEQAAQIETAVSNVDVLDFESDVPEGCRRLLMELDKLLNSCHALRDQMHESLVAVMVIEERLPQVDANLKTDELTGLANRTGVEAVFQSFRAGDAQQKRVASVAMIDIDGLATMNRAQGPRFGDQLIEACGRMIDKAMRKNRGYDVSARFDGQRFLLFYGDTGPRNATSAVERTRQTIEQTMFIHRGTEIEFTISCGVTEVDANDSTEEVFRRANRATQAAQAAGRNRTFLDEGDGPQPIEAPDLMVTGHTVTLND